jgi:hypothetical protein
MSDISQSSPAYLSDLDYAWPYRSPLWDTTSEELQSPRWWLKVLSQKLDAERRYMALMDDYYSGNQPLPFVPRELEDEYREMLTRSRMNFMEVVVDSRVERLRVDGFRWSGLDAASADLAASDIWQSNGLDAAQSAGFTDALVKRRTYLSIWAPAKGSPYPRIRFEDAMQTIAARDPEDPRRIVAALKTWMDEWTGDLAANVYLPDAIYKFRWQPLTPRARKAGSWVEREPAVLNPVGVVPIVPLVNRPRLNACIEGVSELANVYLAQDRINEMLFNRSLAAWTAAYRQKWATGISIPRDPATGQPIQPFNAAIERLWVSEKDTAKFGSFEATDLRNFIESVEQDVQHIAVVKRLPRHYFMQQGQAPSGDSIYSAEAGLIACVRGLQLVFGDDLETAMRLAWQFSGRGTAPPGAQVIWSDPEHLTVGEAADAAIKLKQAGVITTATAQQRIGMSTTEIARESAQLAAEALLADAMANTLTDEPDDAPHATA